MKRLALLLLLLAGCRTLPFPDPHLEGEYGQTLKKWTRSVPLYAGLGTRAFVRVVYLSPQFVTAQAKMISTMRAEMPDQAAETLAHLRDEYRQPAFFAIAYIPDKTANDWNEAGSVWRIALNLGTGEQAPEKIERFERPFNAELRALYPYLDDYSTAYLIRFPPVPSASPQRPMDAFIPEEAHLVIASAIGRMTFNWRLDSSVLETPSEGQAEETPK